MADKEILIDSMSQKAKSRHVWILNHYAVPPSDSGGTRHYNLAKHLSSSGWRATILACVVDHRTGASRLRQDKVLGVEHFDGVDFLWVPAPEYQGSGFGRIVNMLTYSFNVLLPSTLRGLERPDLIIGSSVHPFAALAGLVLSWRYNVPFIFEVRDLWPKTLADFGHVSSSSISYWLLQSLEMFLYTNADRIITLMPYGSEYIAGLGVDPKKVTHIPNGINLADWSSAECLQSTKDYAYFKFFYFGSHGQANALDDLIEAARILQDRQSSIRLTIIGDGPRKSDLIRLADRYRLRNVLFKRPIPKVSLPDYVAKADAFVLPVGSHPELYKYGISPNKLFEYMAAARPIVIGFDFKRNPVSESGAGITVPSESPIELARAMQLIADKPLEERIALGQAGRAFVESKHDYSGLAKKLAAIMDSLCYPGAALENP